VAEAGTRTAVAWKLAERGAGSEDVASIERALRRMRERGQRAPGRNRFMAQRCDTPTSSTPRSAS